MIAAARGYCFGVGFELSLACDFRREIEEPVAGALPVFAHTPLVITEGNYLLLDDDPAWAPEGTVNGFWFGKAGTEQVAAAMEQT